MEVGICLLLPMWLRAEQTFEAENVASRYHALVGVEQVERFLARVSTDYSGFRELCTRTDLEDPGLFVYIHNPLTLKPVILTKRSGYAVPITQYLVDRCTTGVYFDLLIEHGEAFTSAFGPVFERYVGDVLEITFRKERVFGERTYKRGQKSTDWVVVEGRTGTLLECKATRLTVPSKTRADLDLLAQDLAKGVVKGLVQLRRVMDDIRARTPGLEPFYDLDELIPVVVVYDHYYFANAPGVRALVEAQLLERGVEPFAYQVLSIGELERGYAVFLERGISSLLRMKMAATESGRSSAAVLSFDDYLHQLVGEARLPVLPLLKGHYESLLERMGEMLRTAQD